MLLFLGDRRHLIPAVNALAQLTLCDDLCRPVNYWQGRQPLALLISELDQKR